MTSCEMLEERLNGKTYREIGEMCGISKQAVQGQIKHLLNGRSCSKIIYRGVYEYFASDGLKQFVDRHSRKNKKASKRK